MSIDQRDLDDLSEHETVTRQAIGDLLLAQRAAHHLSAADHLRAARKHMREAAAIAKRINERDRSEH